MATAAFEESLDPRASFRAYALDNVAPLAASIDRDEHVPQSLIKQLGRDGYLGAALPRELGGGGWDPVTYGILHEEMARCSASVEGVLNVHNMASQTIVQHGSSDMVAQWGPLLARGEVLAGFALTESAVGSDLSSVETEATPSGSGYVLSGGKKFITCGQVADVFVVLMRCRGFATAFLVERDRPGVEIRPIKGLLGCRGYMLAEVGLDGVEIPESNMVGRAGFGLSRVAATGLDAGRYALAWGCVGIAQACLDACLEHVNTRSQFGSLLKNHQLIAEMVTDMIVHTKAARSLCFDAGRARDGTEERLDAVIAKYYASRVLAKISTDAVQIHGARGCLGEYPVERYFRDARIMEIIEGTSQVHQVLIALDTAASVQP